MPRPPAYRAIVFGSSAGGLSALSHIFSSLPADYPLPLISVQHRVKDNRLLLEEVLAAKSALRIRQAEEKEKILSGTAYIAPPDYHLLIEDDMTFSLASSEAVMHSRPSIDVLFESAATALGKNLIGILLTGANADGSHGMTTMRKNGALTIAQDPDEADFPMMPRSAIETGSIVHVLTLQKIVEFLWSLHA